MKVRDVMTPDPFAVGRHATLKQVAELMVDKGVSGLPVVNSERRVLGVVTEGDLIVKAASHPSSAGIRGLIAPTEGVDDRRLEAVTAADAMTSPAVTIEEDASIAEAARLLVERGIKRLPVVSHDRLAGIVSRADLVRAFARPDSEIEEEIRADAIARRLWLRPEQLEVEVAGGRVVLGGEVRTETEAELVEAFVWRIPGVVSVDVSGLTWPGSQAAGTPVSRTR